jgi:hypothetical protein
VILFKPEHVGPILRREKIQTRRIGKRRWRVGSIHQAKINFKKGSKTFAHLRIKVVRKEPLGCISEEDARKEGYPSVEAYKEVFKRIYKKWDPDLLVWVVDFEVVGE